MRIEQVIWNKELGWKRDPPGALTDPFQLVLIFRATSVLKDPKKDFRKSVNSIHPRICSAVLQRVR